MKPDQHARKARVKSEAVSSQEGAGAPPTQLAAASSAGTPYLVVWTSTSLASISLASGDGSGEGPLPLFALLCLDSLWLQ